MYYELLTDKVKIKELQKKEEVLLLDPTKVSEEAIELAYYLCKKAMKNKTNIAKQEKYEFLLWLSGKKDISQAKNEVLWKEGNALLIDLFRKGRKGKIRKKATPLEIENISLSRI